MRKWALATLGELVKISSGRTPPSVDGVFAVMGANGRIGSAPEANFGPGYLVGRVGAAGAITRISSRCWASDNTLTVVPRPPIDSDFLGHILVALDLPRLATRTAQPLITQTDLGKLEIFLPPLEEQRQIAAALDAIDETIQATERIIAKLVVTGRALLTALARQSAIGGESVPLGRAGTWLSGGTPSTSESSFWGGPIPWITASSIRGKYLSRSTRTLTTSGVASGSRLVPPGTLICVVRGMSLKNEFRVGIAEVEVAFGQDCKALRPSEDWLPEFLHMQLIARESKILELVDEASHGTGRLQMSLLGSVSIDCVPLREQHRLVTISQAHEKRVATELDALTKLRRTRSGLAADLLSGRVRTEAA